jgi:hypothetical protein
MAEARVILFKEGGKFYCQEYWEIPEKDTTPDCMIHSKHFRRIGNGAVLVDSPEHWGFPHLFPSIEISPDMKEVLTCREPDTALAASAVHMAQILRTTRRM